MPLLTLTAAALISCATFSHTVAATEQGVAAAFIEQAANRFSGDDALATVRYLDNYWRYPGNSGFNAGITKLVELLEAAGYVNEAVASVEDRLLLRIDSRPLGQPTWEPLDGELTVSGEAAPLLEFSSNRNMLAIQSNSTPPGGIEAEVVYVGRGSRAEVKAARVRGKVVFADAHPWELSRIAAAEGAAGVLAYWVPAFNRPDVNQDAIVHEAIAYDSHQRAWAILLSTRARNHLKSRLEKGPTQVQVVVSTAAYDSPSLTLVAEARGARVAEERFVFSAHLQEPGANDNASGVATLAEIADVVAQLVKAGEFDPQRTMTFVWGDEFNSVAGFLGEDRARAERVRWGLSLDMVGENTELTGGSFLIEKMPDPSAIWTRGTDKHSEWGGAVMRAEEMTPHYFNDLTIAVCRDVGHRNDWVVNTNPYEGGSDHESFLHAGRPGLLFWHFTDQFYHTDLDRLDKVSAQTMTNVATCALSVAMLLTMAGENEALEILALLARAAAERLDAEKVLSLRAVDAGADSIEQRLIINTWTDWYVGAVNSLTGIEFGQPLPQLRDAIAAAASRIQAHGAGVVRLIDGN